MNRPKFLRDPIHLQLRFENVDINLPIPDGTGAGRSSWLLRNLIDCSEVQRLRFIRQTGLANLVFHGAEHSRFSHSMGVLHLAHEMYDRIVRNMGEETEHDTRLAIGAAALLHDIRHGPFSHTLEEILDELGVPFDHETMTQRIISNPETSINKFLSTIDATFPDIVLAYIDKEKRKDDKWQYKLVSSQLDADRLDYLLRDARFAGLRGHTFDLARLLDLLHHVDNRYIAVEEGGLETVEAYIVALDQMYRAVYYHHTIRSANMVLSSCIARAVELHKSGDTGIFPDFRGERHPLCILADVGDKIELDDYLRLSEHHVWTLVEFWTSHDDVVLNDLANRIYFRKLFKAKDFDPLKFGEANELIGRAERLAIDRLEHVDDMTVKYYVNVDEPFRTSYRRYDFKPEEGATESIWIIGDNRTPQPIEEEEGTRLVTALVDAFHAHRLIFPEEIATDLLN